VLDDVHGVKLSVVYYLHVNI